MSFDRLSIGLLGLYLFCILSALNAADVVVQLNVNRPLNDVNEKFVSFAIKPEELYRALDGDNRRAITRMAAMLGDSYIKFTNDYNFAMDSELKLSNPTNIIWKGFNRWARAVNWTMIVPVPYDPETWDPRETLSILNSSYLSGITDCIWQLGTDFGSSHAEDYVAELSTLNVMVDSFKSYVDDWRIMGADISGGSSADETLRYIEMSKGLNAAFGWSQSTATPTTNSLSTLPQDSDPALQVLLREEVPVWLTLPPKVKAKSNGVMTSDEATEALQWAKILGEAASTGFDAVFKSITAAELERPNFSYFVSALFKKVMGSRVFPARPWNVFTKINKLYTHCANTVSGGIAFMMVNSNEHALQVQVHSLSKISATEVWQYTLSMKNGAVLLNDQRLFYNSTLRPKKSLKQANKAILLSTPGRSVSFWVLPTANLEHCQYTEIVADEVSKESGEITTKKRYSSSDKLLRTLIQESSVTKSALARAFSRRRRYTSAEGVSRPKRFVLKDKQKKAVGESGWGKLFKPFANVAPVEAPEEERPVRKRENVVLKPLRPPSPFDWFTELMENTMTGELPLLRRGARSIDKDGDVYFGPLFATRDGKTTKAFTKKITEIKKPERPIKPLFDMDKFDEEEYFQKIGNQREPEHPQLPDGDVILKHITNPEGDEIDEYKEEQQRLAKPKPPEIVNEMKPLKLLPTELYEGLPLNPFKPVANSFSIGGALNSLLFPEPFTKKPAKTKKIVSIERDIKQGSKATASQVSQLAKEFVRKQKELSLTFGEDIKDNKGKAAERPKTESEELFDVTTMKTNEESATDTADSKSSSVEVESQQKSPKFGFKEFLPDRIENFFSDQDDTVTEAEDASKSDEVATKPKFDEAPWWDLSSKRTRRSLLDDFAGILQGNLITKDEDLIPLGANIPPEQLANYEYRVVDPIADARQETATEQQRKSTDTGLVATFKEKVNDVVDIFSRHLGEWYNTLTKNIERAGSDKEKADVTTKGYGKNDNFV